MERQYKVFIVAISVIVGIISVVAYFYPQISKSAGSDSSDVIEAQLGKKLFIRYSGNVISTIENLPPNKKNNLTLTTSSQLHNIALGGLGGEFRYDSVLISFTQDGQRENLPERIFKSQEYRFFPDPGTNSTYTYQNVKYNAAGPSDQLVATFEPLSSAKVGEKYLVNLQLDTGILKYDFSRKTIEIVS